MKEIVAKEFLYFFVALITAVPIAFFFVYLLDLDPSGSSLTTDEEVLEIDLLLIGALLGFVGVYLARLTVWAVKQLVGNKN